MIKLLRPTWIHVSLAAAAVGLIVSGCGVAQATTVARTGHVVTYAELPSTIPNYIFPLESSTYYTDPNAGQFANIMWPSLYVIGNHNSLSVDQGASVAELPSYSNQNKVVTITLKHWLWSNGKPITARDVVFWLNLVSAASDPDAPTVGTSSKPGPGWGDASPGKFPENIVSYQQTGTYSLVLRFNQSYSPSWLLDTELTQIFPIPHASWDKLSSSGAVGNYDHGATARTLLSVTTTQTCTDCYVPSHPGTATSGALGVAQFLNSQSQNPSTYTTSRLWKTVSGAFSLRGFSASGYVKMVPNQRYSGTPKPEVAAFEEVPFASDVSEFDALKAGSVDVGYIPSEDLADKSSVEKGGYRLSPWNVLSANLALYNFTDPTVGPIFEQLYFRQAFQSLIDQPQYIKKFTGGIGSVATGPVPTVPTHNVWESSLEAKGVYPYSPSKAVSLLNAHGWNVKPGGVSTCSKPGTGSGECGAGIKPGQPATFAMLYDNDEVAMTDEVEAMQSTMKQDAGISISLKGEPFADVLGVAFGNCSFTKPCTNWELLDWGDAGYDLTFPTAFPSGDVFFSTVNQGDWVSQQNTSNIQATLTAPTQKAEVAAMHKYEDYVARQVPMWMLPNGPYQLTLYKADIKGFAPQSIFPDLFPQDYRVS
ncbi:MAG: ABC transporter substrate-binding protein [Candidatus Dormibacteria bacterium]